MRNFFLILWAVTLITGCYHINVQQGNIIDQDMASQLRLGMNKNKISSILGTPLLNDMFDNNTWSYVYTNQINGGKLERKNLTLKFKNNQLVKIY